jgi:hypothetical protein
MIFAGDFYQLPPVRDYDPLYKVPTYGSKEAHVRGYYLWHSSINASVELLENHRQGADPAYFQVLEHLRVGRPTRADIDLLNTRVIGSLPPGEVLPPPGTPLVVSSNKDRQELEQNSFLSYLRSNPVAFAEDGTCRTDWASRGAIVIEASFTKSRNSRRQLASNVVPFLLNQPDVFWKQKMTSRLCCLIGRDYFVTENNDVIRDEANGSRCTLLDIHFTDDAVIQFKRLPIAVGGGGVHVVSAKYVTGLLVQHHKKSAFASTKVYSTLPEGQFIVSHVGKPKSKKVKLNGNEFTVSVRQLPIISAVSCTCHKMQASTVDHIVLACLGDPRCANGFNKDGWLYVLLSRVTMLAGLYLVKPLSTEVGRYRVRADVNRLVAKLRRMAVSTMLRFGTRADDCAAAPIVQQRPAPVPRRRIPPPVHRSVVSRARSATLAVGRVPQPPPLFASTILEQRCADVLDADRTQWLLGNNASGWWQSGHINQSALDRMTRRRGADTVDECVVEAFLSVLRTREKLRAPGEVFVIAELQVFNAAESAYSAAPQYIEASRQRLTDATAPLFANIDHATRGELYFPVAVQGHYVSIVVQLMNPRKPQVLDSLKNVAYTGPVLKWYLHWITHAAPRWFQQRCGTELTFDALLADQRMPVRQQTRGTNSCPAFVCFYAQLLQSRRSLADVFSDQRCNSSWLDRHYRPFMRQTIEKYFIVLPS